MREEGEDEGVWREGSELVGVALGLHAVRRGGRGGGGGAPLVASHRRDGGAATRRVDDGGTVARRESACFLQGWAERGFACGLPSLGEAQRTTARQGSHLRLDATARAGEPGVAWAGQGIVLSPQTMETLDG